MMKRLLSILAITMTVNAGYAQYSCIPAGPNVYPTYPNSCSNGYYINEVKTTGGTLNITNSGTTCGTTSTNYTYYTGSGKILQVDAGVKVTFTVKYSAPSNQLQRTAIWIDYDHMNGFNNIFYPAAGAELISSTILNTGVVPPSTTGSEVIIPLNAKHGPTRMRVRSFALAAAVPSFPPGTGVLDPCVTAATVLHGETEDYDVFINNPCTKVNGIVFSNVTSKGADVKWKPKGNEKQFEYIVDKVRADPGDGNRYINGATNSMHIPDTFMKYIECDAKYYFHIRAICDTDSHFPGTYYYGPWSLDSFTTPPCCNNPSVDVTNITSYTALANWGPVTSVWGYEYAIRVDTIVPTSGMKLKNTSVFLPGLQCSKEYYFFLRALCSPTPTSDWVVDSFLTQPCLSIDNTPQLPEFNLNVYPNPVKDIVTLSVMHGMKLTNADITVTDLTGKVIMTKIMENDKIEIDLRDVPTGMYLVKYADGDRTRVAKIHKE